MTSLASARRSSLSEVRLSIADDWLVACPEGALWWADEKTLIVSDLHLEKGSSHAASSGQMLPPYDTRATLIRIEALLDQFEPERIISLGDSFHDRSAEYRLSPEDRTHIRALTSRVDWYWVEGNHDPDPPQDLGGTAMKEWRCRSLVFRHEPLGDRGEIAGHLHPVARISGRGRSVRRRCFITNGEHMIVPALGAYAGGLNVLNCAIEDLFPTGRSVFVMGSDRVLPVAGNRLLDDVPRNRTGWRL